MNLASFIDAKWEWSKRTFGPGRRTKGICEHITKELAEIKDAPTDIDEWVDVIFLALDGASRAGYNGAEVVSAMEAKHVKNLGRNWPPLREGFEDEAIEHIRE